MERQPASDGLAYIERRGGDWNFQQDHTLTSDKKQKKKISDVCKEFVEQRL